MTIRISRINGNDKVNRATLVRNTMDYLEGNEKYGRLTFDDCIAVTDKATNKEMIDILADRLTATKIIAIADR